MPSNPPRSRRGPQAGSGPEDYDPSEEGTERHDGTEVSQVSRGGAPVDDDPEQYNATSQRPSHQAVPAQGLQQRKKLPAVHRGAGKLKNDPERSHKTATIVAAEPSGVGPPVPPEPSDAEWEAPPGKMSREMSRLALGEESGELAEDDPALDESGADGEVPSEYHTGNDYPVGDDEVSMGEGKSLEGDGLDALDPDIDLAHSKTKNLPIGYDASDDESQESPEGADDANATNAGRPLKLEIVGGPDTGKKKKFKGVRLVIGRTPGVDLQLTDQSVSRRHVELVVGDGGVILRDLGSGNGTKVNGEKITEKALVHGDEIHIGKTKLRFVDEVGAFQAARVEAEKKEAEAAAGGGEGQPEGGEGEGAQGEGEAASEDGAEAPAEGEDGAAAEGEAAAEGAEGEPAEGEEGAAGEPAPTSGSDEAPELTLAGKFMAIDPKKRMAVFGGIALLFLVVIVLLAMRQKPPPPPDPLKAIAAEKMQQARDAVREQRFEEAIALIEQAELLSPGIDQTHLATQARGELGATSVLDDVRKLIDAKKFEDARAALAKAPAGSVKTEEERKKLTEELGDAEAAYRKQRFQEMIAQGEVAAAEQAIIELKAPDRRDMAPVLDEAKRAMAQAQAEERRQAAEEAANAKARGKLARAEQIQEELAVVQRKFAGQEWARAAAECDRVIDANPGQDDIRKKARSLQQLIPNFGRNWDEGMKKFRANQLVAAAKPLHKAYELYQQIGFETTMGEELKEKLAQAAMFSGNEALMHEDLATAAMYFREAGKLDPDEPKAKEMLDEVVGRADEVYQGAYMIRDRDPAEALKRFKVVVEITPSGSTVHENAKNQISRLQP
ncbi:MAG: FHA domain-containing protein [Archangiaceae bacterium]|nr:FHA domain-containing protein [Archangiaceae bacterium]